MAVPKSVIRINKDGVQYISNVDRCQYTIRELTRAALRDVGKFICRKTNEKILNLHPKGLGKTNRIIKHKGATKGKNYACEYWVRKRECDALVGFKHDAWYSTEQELGTKRMPKKGFLTQTAKENVPEIVKIESQYLSALEDEARALALIDSEDDYEGGADED